MQSANIAMYFDETGELWVTHGTVIGVAADHKGLRVGALFEGWSSSLRRAMWFLDWFHADPRRRVEIGVTGLSDVFWPGQWTTDRKLSRKPTFRLEATQRDWSNGAQATFLAEGFAKLCDVFGRPVPSLVQAKAQIAPFDRGDAQPPWLS